MRRLSLFVGIHVCIKSVERLLTSAKLLIGINPDHALGLYIFAVEEFGKALLLKENFVDDDKVIQNVPKSIFGGWRTNSHKEKMEKAREILKKEGLDTLMVGEKITIPSGTNEVLGIKIKDYRIAVVKGTTGTFLTDVMIDYDVRNRCFYVDYDADLGYWLRWKANLQTDKKVLEKYIEKFLKILPNYDVLKK